MATNVIRAQTPEERELAAKKTELAALELQLAQRELDFATLQAEWHAFEQRYLRTVGVKFSEIDDLEAQIAEALSRSHPSDQTASHRASEARAKATESAGVTGSIDLRGQSVDFKPSDNLKSLFREIAKRIHPDLTTDDAERTKRNQLMAEANRAYSEGDEAKLRAILSEWETSPDAVPGDGIGAELVRTIRKIYQVISRLAAIDNAIGELNSSDLGLLKEKAEAQGAVGRDLLAEMSERLDIRIAALRQRMQGFMPHGSAP